MLAGSSWGHGLPEALDISGTAMWPVYPLLLFLCFPVKAAPILLAAAAIGSVLPLPKGWGAGH